mmetsp:Transcript_7935/g.11992  ORF Transcript_7935/g.11992 Transcript_7935/m.11992 type:complete len:334 (-) Transcript_7935:69-1070(-)
MTRSPSEIIASLQQIITDYSPEDTTQSTCDTAQEDVAQLLQLQEITHAEKLAIAELLPSPLISDEVVASLVESGLPNDLGLISLIRKIVSVPCVSVDAKANRRRWLRMLIEKFDASLPTSDRVTLAFAYVHSYDDHRSETTEEEVCSLTSFFLTSLQDALENYANEKYVFDIDRIHYLLSSSAADLLLDDEETDVALLLKLLRKPILNIDQHSNYELPKQYTSLQKAIQTVTRDLELYRFIRHSLATSICFRSVHRILMGDENLSAESAFDAFHDHKVVRYLIFVDKICKLDEVSKCIVLNVQGSHGASKLLSTDITRSLVELKSLVESVASK